MGWTSYHVSSYKINRKAEMDSIYSSSEKIVNGFYHPEHKVLKSAMIGSTYYAAVKVINNQTKEEYVYGAVALTSINNNDYYNFSVKEMSEDMGPYQCQCPLTILALLSSTENEYAKEWRYNCYKYHERKQKLNSLVVGNKIRFCAEYDSNAYKKGEEVILTRIPIKNSTYHWRCGKNYRWKTSQIPEEFEII